MLGFLKQIFRRRHKAFDLAKSHQDQDFLDSLRAMNLVLLGALDHEGLPLDSVTEGALLEAIERAAQQLAGVKLFSPFQYLNDGQTYLPFFTSQAAADDFCGAYCGREGRIFQFNAFTLGVAALAASVTSGAQVVMDPQSDTEHVLTPSQLARLRSMAGDTDLDLAASELAPRALIAPAPI